MKKFSWFRPMLAALALALPLACPAALVTGTYSHLGGASWRADLNLENDGTPALIAEFQLFFSEVLFSNLVALATPAGWDPLVAPPSPGGALPGFVDYLVLDSAAALAPGDSLAGFSIGFDYLGDGAPGALAFDIVDPDSFAVLFSGLSSMVVIPGAAVPEPGSAALVTLALIALAWRNRMAGRQSTASGKGAAA